MARQNDRLTIAHAVWNRALGLPYRWGGDDPLDGFDCSGLVIEGLKSCGLFPADDDDTAAELAKRYPPAVIPDQGMLVFWGAPRIIHVEIVWTVLGEQVFTLGASGGGSRTTGRAEAVQQNAYVKIRPKSGWVALVDPFAGVSDVRGGR